MGIEKNFAKARGRILLLEPVPAINKVFSLVVQEKQQRGYASNAGTRIVSIASFGESSTTEPSITTIQ